MIVICCGNETFLCGNSDIIILLLRMGYSCPDESQSLEMSARFHSNLAAYCLLIYDLYMVHVTDDASSFRILNSYWTYNTPLNKCAFLSDKYALLTWNTRFYQKNVLLVWILFLHCNPYDYGAGLHAKKFQCGLKNSFMPHIMTRSHKAPVPENKYPCGVKNFAMALVQKQSNGI